MILMGLCSRRQDRKKIKKPHIAMELFLVAGTGLEPVSAAADMSPE